MIRTVFALALILAPAGFAAGPGPGSVAYLVTDRGGKPVAGAEVGVWNE